MVLFTIINEYDIFAAQNSISEPQYKKIEGGIAEYRKGTDGESFFRLHTTDLTKYLSEEYDPSGNRTF